MRAGKFTGITIEVYKTQSADSPLTALQCSGTIVSNFGMTDADDVRPDKYKYQHAEGL